jgi:hypothetical protein
MGRMQLKVRFLQHWISKILGNTSGDQARAVFGMIMFLAIPEAEETLPFIGYSSLQSAIMLSGYIFIV